MKSFDRFLILFSAMTILSACDGRREKTGSGDGDATFKVDSVSLEKEDVLKVDSFGLPSTKKFQFQACLIDAVSDSGIAKTEFGVTDGKVEVSKVTEADGCLKWEEVHQISSLQKERQLRIKRTFVAKKGFEGRITLELGFNPWADGGDLVDLRKFNPSTVETETLDLEMDSNLMRIVTIQASGETTAFVSDLELEFQGHDKSATQINNLLTLKTAQKFRMKLNPQFVKRNLKNEQVRVDVKGGQFKIKLVVLRDGSGEVPSLSDLVASYEGDITVLYDGSATSDIVLRIHDTAAIMSRNRVTVAIEPLSESSGLASAGYYTGFIEPLRGNSVSITLAVPTEKSVSVKRALENVLAESNKAVPTGYQLLKEKSGFKQIAGAVADSLLKSVPLNFNGDKKRLNKVMMTNLCKQIYASVKSMPVRTKLYILPDYVRDVPMSTLCEKRPEDFLNVQSRDFVDQVHGSPKEVVDAMGGDTRSISITKEFSYEMSNGTTWGSEFEANAEANLGASLSVSGGVSAPPVSVGVVSASAEASAGAKVSINQKWYAVYKKSKTSSATTTVNQSGERKLELNVIADTYTMDVSVRRCVFVARTVNEGHPGLFTCSKGTSRRQITEKYFLVDNNRDNTPFFDNQTNSRWRLTIRGEESYQNFAKLMGSKETVLQFTAMETATGDTTPLLPDFRVTQVFPGAVSK